MKTKLSLFRYTFAKGPLPRNELSKPLTEGDCRTALQEYFFVFEDRYFTKEELLNPQGYLTTGKFIKKGYTPDFFSDLPQGTVLYAERSRNKHGAPVSSSPAAFEQKEDYLIALHSAVFLGMLDAEARTKFPDGMIDNDFTGPGVWHATGIDGASCVWQLDKFMAYYRPVAAKRF